MTRRMSNATYNEISGRIAAGHTERSACNNDDALRKRYYRERIRRGYAPAPAPAPKPAPKKASSGSSPVPETPPVPLEGINEENVDARIEQIYYSFLESIEANMHRSPQWASIAEKVLSRLVPAMNPEKKAFGPKDFRQMWDSFLKEKK